MGEKIALTDPVCAQEDYASLLTEFLKVNPRAAFVYVSEECAEGLRALGFKANVMGPDSILNVQTYNTLGNWKELDLIKRARNEMKREGLVVREEDLDKIDTTGLEEISRKWLGSKILNQREIWVYARRPVFENEKDVRKFIAYDRDGCIIGFVFYDPIYRDGQVVGYCNNTCRCDETRFGKVHVAINLVAMDLFKREGREFLNIGLAPFTLLDSGKFNDDWATKKFFGINWRYGNDLYNFKGLCNHKLKYRGQLLPKYLVSNSLMPSNDMYLAYLAADIASGYLSTMGRLALGVFKETFHLKSRKPQAAKK